MYRTIRMFHGNRPYLVTGRVLRDTGSGFIVLDSRGMNNFAFYHNVVHREPEDLFAPLVDKRLRT